MGVGGVFRGWVGLVVLGLCVRVWVGCDVCLWGGFWVAGGRFLSVGGCSVCGVGLGFPVVTICIGVPGI